MTFLIIKKYSIDMSSFHFWSSFCNLLTRDCDPFLKFTVHKKNSSSCSRPIPYSIKYKLRVGVATESEREENEMKYIRKTSERKRWENKKTKIVNVRIFYCDPMRCISLHYHRQEDFYLSYKFRQHMQSRENLGSSISMA